VTGLCSLRPSVSSLEEAIKKDSQGSKEPISERNSDLRFVGERNETVPPQTQAPNANVQSRRYQE
jgi:hypothetical protein